MRQIVPFSVFTVGTLLLTSCATSSNMINDDVYSVKEVEVPIGTDITDETDYSAYVYNKEKTERKNTYYDEFNRNQNTMMPVSPGFRNRSAMSFGMGYGMYGSPYYSPYYNPYYGMGYYDPYWGRGYGYGYYGNYYPYEYYGYASPWYGSGYGYGYGPYGVNYYPYYSNSTSNSSTSSYSSNYHRGKRGAVAGTGGVNSNSGNSLKSAKAPNPGAGNGKGSVVKPTNSSPTTTVSKPVTNSSVAGRPVSATSLEPVSGRTNGSVRTVNPQVSSPTRPTVGTTRTLPSPSRTASPTRTASPSREIQSRPSRTISAPSSTPSTPSRVTPSGSGGSRPSGGAVSRPASRPGR